METMSFGSTEFREAPAPVNDDQGFGVAAEGA